MTEIARAGGCLCGAVRFEVSVPSATYSICHCRMCRRWSAGPFMSSHAEGAPRFTAGGDLVTWYRGSPWAERGFCSRCGSTMFWRLAEQPDTLTAVSVEALDEASEFTLHRHIYVDAQPARYAFGDDRPRVTEAEGAGRARDRARRARLAARRKSRRRGRSGRRGAYASPSALTWRPSDSSLQRVNRSVSISNWSRIRATLWLITSSSVSGRW